MGLTLGGSYANLGKSGLDIVSTNTWSASIKTDTFVKPIVTQIVQVNNNYC